MNVGWNVDYVQHEFFGTPSVPERFNAQFLSFSGLLQTLKTVQGIFIQAIFQTVKNDERSGTLDA
jgi:hypothetical protein